MPSCTSKRCTLNASAATGAESPHVDTETALEASRAETARQHSGGPAGQLATPADLFDPPEPCPGELADEDDLASFDGKDAAAGPCHAHLHPLLVAHTCPEPDTEHCIGAPCHAFYRRQLPTDRHVGGCPHEVRCSHAHASNGGLIGHVRHLSLAQLDAIPRYPCPPATPPEFTPNPPEHPTQPERMTIQLSAADRGEMEATSIAGKLFAGMATRGDE